MATVKKVLEKLPGFSQGVRLGAALRDVALVQPICPNSQIRGKIVNGQYEPPDIKPGMENCQLEGMEARWWENCEARGHDPYFRTARLYTTIDIEETDPETGDVYVTGTKKKVRVVRVPNVTRVAKDIRHNSGLGIHRKMKYLGYKRLEDLGFEEVCQFRSCQKPVTVSAEGVGDYCSLLHLNLIAAREEGEYIVEDPDKTAGLGAGQEVQIKRRREKQLRETMPRVVKSA